MDINIWYEINSYNSSVYSHIAVADKLYEYFKESYRDINVSRKQYLNRNIDYINDDPSLLKLTARCTSFFYIIIENPNNGKYFVISYADKGGLEVLNFPDYNNLVELFPIHGMHNNDFQYKELSTKYTPISKVAHILISEIEGERLYKMNTERIIPERLYHRSCAYTFRKWLYENDSRFDIRCERISEKGFMEEMNKFHINIDLNCVAGESDRTINAMCLGTALIRPRPAIKYHNELIPNYHYAEVECEDLANYKLLADAYISKFEEIKKDSEYVKFLCDNGRKYYEENNTLDSHMAILKKVIDINKLL